MNKIAILLITTILSTPIIKPTVEFNRPLVDDIKLTTRIVPEVEIPLEIPQEVINEEVDVIEEVIEEEVIVDRRVDKHIDLEETVQAWSNNYVNVYDLDLSVPTDVTAYELDRCLEGTGLEGLGYYYVDAEINYGVNALFVASISALESGWGNSHFAVTRNNLFGYGSFDYDLDNTYYFDSKADGIYIVAEALANNYLSANGMYHYGTNISAVNVKYSSSDEWDDKVASIMYSFYNKIYEMRKVALENGEGN